MLRDAQDRTLECEILKRVSIEGTVYVLIMPVDPYVEVLVWDSVEAEGMDDDFEGVLDEPSPDDLEAALPTAQAVLSELNLSLHRNAYDVLTVQGEIPQPSEEDILEIAKDEDEIEEYYLLTTFFHNNKQFGIFTPLDPLLLYAVEPDDAAPYLLTPDFPEALFEQLEAYFLDLVEEELSQNGNGDAGDA